MFIVFCSMGFGKHRSKAQQPNGRRACNDAEDRMEDTSKTSMHARGMVERGAQKRSLEYAEEEET